MSSLYHIQHGLFTAGLILSYVLVISAYLGISINAPKYLDELDYYMRIYISLFLLWRFNPFRTIVFTELDRKIAFSAGLFIITTTALNKYIVLGTDFMKNIAYM